MIFVLWHQHYGLLIGSWIGRIGPVELRVQHSSFQVSCTFFLLCPQKHDFETLKLLNKSSSHLMDILELLSRPISWLYPWNISGIKRYLRGRGRRQPGRSTWGKRVITGDQDSLTNYYDLVGLVLTLSSCLSSVRNLEREIRILLEGAHQCKWLHLCPPPLVSWMVLLAQLALD